MVFARLPIAQMQGWLGQVKCRTSNGLGCILQAKATAMLASAHRYVYRAVWCCDCNYLICPGSHYLP